MKSRFLEYTTYAFIAGTLAVSGYHLWEVMNGTAPIKVSQELKDIQRVLMVLCEGDQYCQEFVGQIGR